MHLAADAVANQQRLLVGSKYERIDAHTQRQTPRLVPVGVEGHQLPIVAGDGPHRRAVRGLSHAGDRLAHRHLLHAFARGTVEHIQVAHLLLALPSHAGQKQLRSIGGHEDLARAHNPVEGLDFLARRKVDASHVEGAVVGAVQQIPLGSQRQRHGAAPRPRFKGAARGRIGAAAESQCAKLHRAHKRLQRHVDYMNAVGEVVANIDKSPSLIATQPKNLMPHGNGGRGSRARHRNRGHLTSAGAPHENGISHGKNRSRIAADGNTASHFSSPRVDNRKSVCRVLRNAQHPGDNLPRKRLAGSNRLLLGNWRRFFQRLLLSRYISRRLLGWRGATCRV